MRRTARDTTRAWTRTASPATARSPTRSGARWRARDDAKRRTERRAATRSATSAWRTGTTTTTPRDGGARGDDYRGLHSDDEDDAAAFVDRDEDGRPLHNQLPGGIGARALALGYNPRTAEDPVLDPGLYLVGTPIGNLEDITLRALRVLRSADAVLCEDTRHTKRLLARYSIEPLKLVSYHAHNERRRREPLLDKMRRGASLALVSDAGTPGVADPGADLAAACAEEGIAVRPIPGPSAAAAAVAMAGIPVDEGFTFCGFLPPKSGTRRKKLETLRPIKGSLVAFVPPHKLVNTLKDCAEVLGDRNCCVCREMTKVRAAVPVVFGFWILDFFWFWVWFVVLGPGAEGGDDYANYVP